MNKKIFGFVVLCFMLSFGFVACNDDDDIPDSNSEWALQNDAYLDSIVNEATANRIAGEEGKDGDIVPVRRENIVKDKWSIKRYATQSGEDDSFLFTPNKLQRVYIKWIEDYNTPDAEEIYPMYTDSVKVCYRGKYYNGSIFDSNYSGDFDPDRVEPVTFALSEVVAGWASALMYMPVGTRAEIYIPYTLGYGVYGRGDIPGYTTLVFDVYLDKVVHPKGPDDRKLKSFRKEEGQN